MDEANKSALRAEVELLTRVYLEDGGKIEKVPTGKGALVEMTAQERVRAFSFFGPKCSRAGSWVLRRQVVGQKRTTRTLSRKKSAGALGHWG